MPHKKILFFLLKRPKFLVILYFVVVVLFFQFYMGLNKSVVRLEEDFVSGLDLGSKTEFPIEHSGLGDFSDLIVVIHSTQGSNLLNEYVFNLTMDIREWLINTWDKQRAYEILGVADFFSNVVNLYNATIDFSEYQIKLVNVSNEIIWGLAYTFGYYWNIIYGLSGDVSKADSTAGKVMNDSAEALYYNLEYSDLEEKDTRVFRELLRNYTIYFIDKWNYLRNHPTLYKFLPPYTSIEVAVTNVSRETIRGLVIEDSLNISWRLRVLLNLTSVTLNYSTWDVEPFVLTLVYEYFEEAFGASLDFVDTKFLRSIYNNIIFSDASIYWSFYWVILNESIFPPLFPVDVFEFVKSTFVSEDGDTLLIGINLVFDEDFDVSDFAPYLDSLNNYLGNLKSEDLEIFVVGDIVILLDASESIVWETKLVDLVALILVFAISLVLYRRRPISSLISTLLVFSALVLVKGALVVSSNFFNFSYGRISLVLLTLIIYGFGSLQILLLLSKYKKILAEGYSIEDALTALYERYSRPFLLSGEIFVLAILPFTLNRFAFLVEIGFMVLLAIALVLFLSFILLPSIITLVGDKIFWSLSEKKKHAEGNDILKNRWIRRLVKFGANRVKITLIVLILVLIPAFLIYGQTPFTYEESEFLIKDKELENSYLLFDEEAGILLFPSIHIVASFEKVNFTTVEGSVDVALLEKYVAPITNELLSLNSVLRVLSAYTPYGAPIPKIKKENATLEDLVLINASKLYLSNNGTATIFYVFFNKGFDISATQKVLDEITEVLESIKGSYDVSVTFRVGGKPVVRAEISHLFEEDALIIVCVSLISTFLVFSLAVRSPRQIFVSGIYVISSIVLALAISKILSSSIFQKYMVWFVPILSFSILLGIGLTNISYLLLFTNNTKEIKGEDVEESRKSFSTHATVNLIKTNLVFVAASISLLFVNTVFIQQLGYATSLGIIIQNIIILIAFQSTSIDFETI